MNLESAVNEIMKHGPNFDTGAPKTEAQATVLNYIARGQMAEVAFKAGKRVGADKAHSAICDLRRKVKSLQPTQPAEGQEGVNRG